MAMAAYLYAVPAAEIERLQKDPESIGRLDGSMADCTCVYLHSSINYFLAGSGYPEPSEHPLGPLLHGMQTVYCVVLENGNFGLVAPMVAERLARHLVAVDLQDVRSRVEEADLDELVEAEELYDLEVVDHSEAPDQIVHEIKDLTAFYARAAAANHGVVMYIA